MTKCKECVFFQPGDVDWNGWCSIELPRWLKVAMVHLPGDVDWNGWCSIELPRWLKVAMVHRPDIDNHFVRIDDGCDLGMEEKK